MADRQPFLGNIGLAKFLFTDASCLPRRGNVSAWAGMLVAGGESVLSGGLIAGSAKDSTLVELISIAMALQSFIDKGVIAHGDRVIICADNDSAILYVNGASTPRKHLRLQAAQAHIEHLAKEHQLTLAGSWVRSHQGSDSTDWRALINARVDRHARHLARSEASQREQAANEARRKQVPMPERSAQCDI